MPCSPCAAWVSDRLARTLSSTNDRIDDLDHPQRQALAGRAEGQALGWRPGMVNAERSFRRIKSCKDMPVLVAALACHTKEVSVQRDLGDRQADQSGVADVGRAAGSTRGPQQIVHKALQCDDEVVETGVHEASLEVDIARATPSLGGLVSSVTPRHPIRIRSFI
jgi:hypothetical protein